MGVAHQECEDGKQDRKDENRSRRWCILGLPDLSNASTRPTLTLTRDRPVTRTQPTPEMWVGTGGKTKFCAGYRHTSDGGYQPHSDAFTGARAELAPSSPSSEGVSSPCRRRKDPLTAHQQV